MGKKLMSNLEGYRSLWPRRILVIFSSLVLFFLTAPLVILIIQSFTLFPISQRVYTYLRKTTYDVTSLVKRFRDMVRNTRGCLCRIE